MSEKAKMETNVEPLKIKPLTWSQYLNTGCGVEFFFAKDGKILAAEKVLPSNPKPSSNGWGDTNNGINRFSADGVQAKMWANQSSCRAAVGNDIRYCFNSIADKVFKDGVTVVFSPFVQLDKDYLNGLSKTSKTFGCDKSLNIYATTPSKETVIDADPNTFCGRFGNGPVYIGRNSGYNNMHPQQVEMYLAAAEVATKDANINHYANTIRASRNSNSIDVNVAVLDIVLGNTCVLIDRDPLNKERRKYYGKAGEYKMLGGGIVYLTLSNFWMRSHPLTSFVMSVGRMAQHLVEQSKSDNDYVKALFSAVKREDVIKAINENDFDLALKNFRAIEEILAVACQGNYGNYPFSKGHMNHFYYFISQGLDHWFDKDIVKYWANMPETHGHGWERWLEVVVGDEYKKLNVDLGDTKYKDVEPETDKQDYVNGYGKNYKPLISKAEKSSTKTITKVEIKDPAKELTSVVITVPETKLRVVEAEEPAASHVIGKLKKIVKRKKVAV